MYNVFVRFYRRITDLLASLLNDENFNGSYPIMRESYKEIYHRMEMDYKAIYDAFFPLNATDMTKDV